METASLPRVPRGGMQIRGHRGGGSTVLPKESWPLMFDTLITGGTTAVGSDRAGGPPPAGRPTIAAAMFAYPEPTLMLMADPDPILLRTFHAACWIVG